MEYDLDLYTLDLTWAKKTYERYASILDCVGLQAMEHGWDKDAPENTIYAMTLCANMMNETAELVGTIIQNCCSNKIDYLSYQPFVDVVSKYQVVDAVEDSLNIIRTIRNMDVFNMFFDTSRLEEILDIGALNIAMSDMLEHIRSVLDECEFGL